MALHLCHAPGILKGTVYGQINRILRLTTYKKDVINSLHHFHTKLVEHGHHPLDICRLINSALQNYNKGLYTKRNQAPDEN